MELRIQNVGPIKDSVIDLTKDFILFTGHNNTGKTYLSYLIFGLSKKDYFAASNIEILKPEISKIFNEAQIQIDLKEVFIPKYDDLINIVSGEIKKILPSLFGNKSLFEESIVGMKWKGVEDYENWIANKNINWTISFGGTMVNIEKPVSSLLVKINYRGLVGQKDTDVKPIFPYELIVDSVQKTLLRSLFEFLSIDTHYIAAERIGIAIFGKDISVNKAKAFDEFLNNPGINKVKFLNTLSQQFNQYPFPIQEAIRSQELRGNYKNLKSSFFDLGEEIEKKILNGKIELSSEGDIELVLTNEKKLSLSLSGSNIKSLSALTYLLKHIVKIGTTLIIDEPEINLHPDNQIILARIICKMINRGIKVIMSTHSDYMIREFNNLLMLSSKKESVSVLKERYGYEESEILDPSKIMVYFMEKNSEGFTDINPIQLENGEIIVKSFNETINKQNFISEDIYYTLNPRDGSNTNN